MKNSLNKHKPIITALLLSFSLIILISLITNGVDKDEYSSEEISEEKFESSFKEKLSEDESLKSNILL